MANPLAQSMQPNLPLSRAILLGAAEDTPPPGSMLFPRVNMDQFGQQEFRYAHLDPSQVRFEELDLRRGWAQPFQEVTLGFTFDTASHVRYGVATWWDWEEVAAANLQMGALRWMARRIDDPRRRLLRSMEGVRLDVATDPASFDEVIDIPGSEEWDLSGGDPRSVIDTAADFISVTGAKPADLELMLSWPAMLALRNSPDWRAFRVASGNERRQEVEDVAGYLGIGSAWVTNYKRWNPTTGAMESAFADSCILRVRNQNPTDLDVSMGSRLLWAVDVGQVAPFATVALQDGKRTASGVAYTDYSQPLVLSPMAAVLIRNCSSTYP